MLDLQSVVSLHNNKWWNHVSRTIYPFEYVSSWFFLLTYCLILNFICLLATDVRFLLICNFKWTSLPSPSSMSLSFEPTLGTFDFRFLWQCLRRCSFVTFLVVFFKYVTASNRSLIYDFIHWHMHSLHMSLLFEHWLWGTWVDIII